MQENTKIAVIDIEAENWHDVIGLGYYDGERYLFFETVKEFCESDLFCENQVIFAHNGGKYDFLFLLQYWLAESKGFYMPRNLISISSSIASFWFKNTQFRDSLKIMPTSLKKLGEMFGHKKTEMDYENIKSQDWKPYLKNDCIITYKILKDYFAYLYKHFGIRPSLTIASQSMKLYRKKFNKITRWESNNEEIIRKGYMGGRCEIFRMFGDGLNVYDINSLYPDAMYRNKFPIGKSRITSKAAGLLMDSEILGFARARINCPEMYIPLLPVRMKKMLFPTGKFTGIWSLSELRKAEELGYKIEKIHYICHWQDSDYIFNDWVETLYNLRKKSKSDSEKYLLKIHLNSLYGKFAQKSEQEEIVLEHETHGCYEGLTPLSFEMGVYTRKKQVQGDFIIPQISAYVTSYARLNLYNYLNDASYYCDTDSVFTTDKLQTSEELGDMKLEEKNVNAKFYQPKVYETDSKVKAKGFTIANDKKLFQRIVNKEKINTTKILSFKESMRRKKRLGLALPLTKSIQAEYDKRYVYHDGQTRAFDMAEITGG